jgi:formylglycine-generating enzyme required for sulfatase activity
MPDDIQTKIAQIESMLKILETLLSGEALETTRKTLLDELAALQQPGSAPAAGGEDAESPASQPSTSRFDQRQQEVQGNQTNIAGDVNGPVLSGEFHGPVSIPAGPDPRQIAFEEAERARLRYLEKLRRQCQALPLAALGGEESADEEITLERVYIELDTTTRAEIEKTPGKHLTRKPEEAHLQDELFRSLDREAQKQPGPPVSALEAAERERRLMLLGDPGSGKSTFVLRLLAWQCTAGLEGKDAPPGIQAGWLPVLIVLRDLAARLAGLPLDRLSGNQREERLLQAVREQLSKDLERLNVMEFTPGLLEAFHSGQCLLVLDGLDEVPVELQPRLREMIQAVMKCCQPQRVLATCRIRSYTGEVVLPRFQAYTLAPFDNPKIEQFAKAWYSAQQELGRVDALQAEEKSQDLAQAAQGEDLQELAQNPMLLTSMAIIHQKEIGLPRERVRLYSLVVDVLLRRWQARRAGSQGLSEKLADFLRDDLRLRAAMERLAYQAHSAVLAEQKAADLPRGEALTLLEAPEYLGAVELAAEFLAYVDQRAGLLVGRGGEPGRPAMYSFPHRTFQEYLAGCHLINQRDALRSIADWAKDGDGWRLALLLGAEDLFYNRRGQNTLLDLTYRLCPHAGMDTAASQRLAAWAGELAVLAGKSVIERDAAPDGGPGYLQRLRARLVEVLAGEISAPERASAGRSLAKLGDPRPEVLTCAAMQFCYIPAGSFTMGSDKKQDPQAFEDESPQHELELPGFWMGRYPVTQAQYGEFVQAEGYAQGKYWLEAQAAKYWSKQGFKGEWDDAPRQAPKTYGEPFDLPNHPVVGVTWYEALAFSRWLGERLGRQVRLPNEAEWEKAARGGLELPSPPAPPLQGGKGVARSPQQGFELPDMALQPNPLPQRVYPWGDKGDPNRGNFDKTGIGTTSAAGCFPGGASPYGVLDLSGNVWEWTRSLWGKDYELEYTYPYTEKLEERENLKTPANITRVLRGGSFYYEASYVRCANRGRNYPADWFRNVGFRVILSHLPAGQ